MDTPLRPSPLRLALTVMTLAALTLAAFWYWHSGRSERHVPEGAYLVQSGRIAEPAAAETWVGGSLYARP